MIPGLEITAELVLFFMFYAFCGWIIECCYVRFMDGEWVNRGFLHGPFVPLYGCGSIIVILALEPFSSHPAALFISSFLLMSALEYFVGWGLEAVFNTKWWDYSNQPFNLKGRICLQYSLYWGVLGIVLVDWIHPAAEAFVSGMTEQTKEVTAMLFLMYFFADVIVSVKHALNFEAYIKELVILGQELRKEWEMAMRELDLARQDAQDEFRQAFKRKFSEGLRQTKATAHDFSRLINSFPSMDFPKAGQLRDSLFEILGAESRLKHWKNRIKFKKSS